MITKTENLTGTEREIKIRTLRPKNLYEWDKVHELAKLIKEEKAKIEVVNRKRVIVMI